MYPSSRLFFLMSMLRWSSSTLTKYSICKQDHQELSTRKESCDLQEWSKLQGKIFRRFPETLPKLDQMLDDEEDPLSIVHQSID
ncbi:hypothetical protein DERP_008438 [Dermatophagoides pteronyssinus]|uniref:Uncharacterized protein n=1 Tax=Dermatophagoides pteronyssinus TaxID=6956 RepID=A0ABQ8IV90_DERPT|nr:hypothetical protein DERP_008438 [Dermatophagoides pteronyssinus]